MGKKLTAIILGTIGAVATAGCITALNSNKQVGYDNMMANVKDDVCNGVKLVRTEMEYCSTFDPITCFKTKGFGTGTVIKSEDGKSYILTAGHVIEADNLHIDLFGRVYELKESKLKVDGIDSELEVLASEFNEEMDYALLKGDGELDTMSAELGDSNKLERGVILYICGHPQALGKNTTEGIVSAKNVVTSQFDVEPGKTIPSQFMFTTPISPGNSGSAIYAVNGGDELHLVGVAVAYYPSGQNLNVGVKINDIWEKIREYIEEKKNDDDAGDGGTER
jgi:S1-C subfamily serine protease